MRFHLFSCLRRTLWSVYTHVLVMPKRLKRTSAPSCCTAEMTSGNTEQSSRNWINLGEDGVQNLSISCLVTDVSDLHFTVVNFFRLSLVSCNAAQFARMWGISSGISLHAVDRETTSRCVLWPVAAQHFCMVSPRNHSCLNSCHWNFRRGRLSCWP